MVKRMLKKTIYNILTWIIVCSLTLNTFFSSASAFTIGEEREVGEKLLYTVRSSFDLLDDPDISQYLTELGNSVLEVAGVQFFDYHFFVINSKDFNAFAAPSGLLFFYSGLIGAMNSEDELISVIAHEIGHIVKRHLAARMETGKYSTLASFGLALAAIAFGGSVAPVLFTGAIATGQSFNLHFSRKNEEEADLLAYRWMKKLHRHPEGQAKMLQTMRRIARYRSDKLPQYLTTHPNPEARLNYIESLLDVDQEITDTSQDDLDNFYFLRFKYRILSMIKDPQTLRPFYKNIIANENSSSEMKIMAKYGLSQVAMIENDYRKSIDLLDEVSAALPDKSILKTDKAVSLYGAGDIKAAHVLLSDALRADSGDMYATFYIAKIFQRQGNYLEAKKNFKKIAYNQPDYSKVYFELGQIASDENLTDVSDFYLGKYNLLEGRFDLAVSNFRKSLASENLPEKLRTEGDELLEKIKKLKK